MAQRLFYDASYTLRNPVASGVHRVVSRCWEAITAAVEESGDGLTLTRTVNVGKRFVAAKEVGSEPTDPHGHHGGAAISFRPGDMLLLPDAYWACPRAWKAVNRARRAGAAVTTLVHDLIPLQHPEIYAVEGAALVRRYLENVIRYSDKIVTVSQTVAGDVEAFVETSSAEAAKSRPRIESWRLGCDLPNANGPVRAEVQQLFRSRMPDSPYLVVGSFDRRKNHEFVLRCFESLWSRPETSDVRLAFVGTPSPAAEPIVDAVRTHPLYGRNLFLLPGLSDAELTHAYRNARAVVVASIAEGFCLPIVEAMQHRQTVFASDIPIHHEVGGAGSEFFSLASDESFLRAIREFEGRCGAEAARLREPVEMPSWEAAARSLLDKVVDVTTWSGRSPADVTRRSHVGGGARPRAKVLYFTITPLGDESNGGSLCCRDHVRQLARDESISLEVVAAAERRHEPGTLAFLADLGVDGAFLPYNDTPGHANARGMPWLTRMWPYAHEQDGLWNSHVGDYVARRVAVGAPDVVVVDYLHSSAFVESLYRGPTPIVTITLNREAEFHADLVRHRYDIGGGAATSLGGARLRRFESWVHARSAAVVAIGRYDLPNTARGRSKAFWFPPLPRERCEGWSYRGRKEIGFVGNIGHYPNKLAVEWLATRFAPALARIDPEANIVIVGAEKTGVPEAWRSPNVRYLGVSDRATVEGMLRSIDFFIAPITNNFGAKLKIYEAMGYGTPLLATESALSGVACLPWLQRIDLNEPASAAQIAADGLAHPERLIAMSQRIIANNRMYVESQKGRWGDLMHHVSRSCPAVREAGSRNPGRPRGRERTAAA